MWANPCGPVDIELIWVKSECVNIDFEENFNVRNVCSVSDTQMVKPIWGQLWVPYGYCMNKPIWACQDFLAHIKPIYACLLSNSVTVVL